MSMAYWIRAWAAFTLIGCATVDTVQTLDLIRVVSLPEKGEILKGIYPRFRTEAFTISFRLVENDQLAIEIRNRLKQDIFYIQEKSYLTDFTGDPFETGDTEDTLFPVRILPVGQALDLSDPDEKVAFGEFGRLWLIGQLTAGEFHEPELGFRAVFLIDGALEVYQFWFKLEIDRIPTPKKSVRVVKKGQKDPLQIGRKLINPLTIRPEDICGKEHKREPCWRLLKEPDNCYFWDHNNAEIIASWFGECPGRIPHGKGKLHTTIYGKIRLVEGHTIEDTTIRIGSGEMNYGRRHGRWFVEGPVDTFASRHRFHYGKEIENPLLRSGDGGCFEVVLGESGTKGIRNLNPAKCQW